MEVTGRRGATVALLATGGCLVGGAVLSFALGLLAHADGYDWDDSTTVRADGRTTAVGVEAGRETLVWTSEADALPRCSVADRDGEVPLRRTDGAYGRAGGSAGGWVAAASFEPRHDVVGVVCERTAGSDVVAQVEPRPRVPPALAAFGDHGAVGLALGGAGLVLLLGCPIALGVRRRHPAPPTAAG